METNHANGNGDYEQVFDQRMRAPAIVLAIETAVDCFFLVANGYRSLYWASLATDEKKRARKKAAVLPSYFLLNRVWQADFCIFCTFYLYKMYSQTNIPENDFSGNPGVDIQFLKKKLLRQLYVNSIEDIKPNQIQIRNEKMNVCATYMR